MKLLGICFVVLADIMFCLKYGNELTKQYLEWCQIRFFLMECIQNNRHARKILPELLHDILLQLDPKTHVCEETALLEKKMRGNRCSFEKEWGEYVGRLQLNLRGNDVFWMHMKELSIVMDRKAPEIIEQYLLQNINKLDELMREEKERIRNRKKVGNAMGCLLGMITILLLI